MKTFLSLCSFLFIIFINSFPSSAANEAVLDDNGEPLQVGTKYYAASLIGGGGLILTKYPNEECRVTVSQSLHNPLPLIPLTFHPARTKEGVVYASKSLNVKFETSVPCANSTVWQVGRNDPRTKSPLIQINGVEGNPGCGTFRNWFKLEKVRSFPHIYRFVFDPEDICDIPIAAHNVSALVPQSALSLSMINKEAFFPAMFIKVNEDVGIKQYV